MARKFYSTTFPATEVPVSQGGLWLNGKADGIDWQNCDTLAGSPNKIYGDALVGVSGADDCISIMKGDWGKSQYVECTAFIDPAYVPIANHEIELLLQFRISANFAKGYEWNFSLQSGLHQLAKWEGDGTLGNLITVLTANGPHNALVPVTGDKIRFTQLIDGSFVLTQNGSLIDTWAEDSGTAIYETFAPGVGFFVRPGAGQDPQKACWSSFVAGSLSAPGLPLIGMGG